MSGSEAEEELQGAVGGETSRSMRLLERLHEGTGELSPADEAAVSRLSPDPIRRRKEIEPNRGGEPWTPEQCVSRLRMPVFEALHAGLSSMNWRMVPKGSGPKIQGGAFGSIKLAYRADEKDVPLEARHLGVLKIQAIKKYRPVWMEVEVLKAVVHENIVDFHGAFAYVPEGSSLADEFDKKAQFYILLEYCSAGDMLKEVERFGKKYMPEAGAKFYLHQICDGLEYLHSKFIVHTDIHMRNIFLKYNPDMTKKCVVADFGMARIIKHPQSALMNTFKIDVGQVCKLAMHMMTEGKNCRPRRVIDLSIEAQELFECMNFNAPYTIQKLRTLKFFADPGVAPIPPKAPSPLLDRKAIKKIGYLEPVHVARHHSAEGAGTSTSRVTTTMASTSVDSVASRAARRAVDTGLAEVRRRPSLAARAWHAVNCFRPQHRSPHH